MWANGPASRSGSHLGQGSFVDQGVADALLAQLGHQAFVVVALKDLVDDPVHPLPLGRDGRLVTTLAPRGLGIAEPLPCGVQQRQVGDGPGLAVLASERLTSSGVSHGAHRRR